MYPADANEFVEQSDLTGYVANPQDVRQLAHVILTRFNLPSEGYESIVRAKEGWLRSRVALFEKYCLPSVRAQKSAHASWIIYFDPESPAWLKEWIEATNHGDFHALFRATVSNSELLSDIRDAVGHHAQMLITTNLDNDDALANNFIARIQAGIEPGRRTALYLADGLIGSGHDVYHRVDVDNAFCSVAEPWNLSGDTPVSCWSNAHNRLGEAMPVKSLRGEPGWLQVIHGENVSNRVRGRLVSPAGYRQLFTPLLDGYPEPAWWRVARDRAVSIPLRAVREGGRGVVKRVTIAVLGHEGLDKVKYFVSRVLGHRPR